MEAPFYTSPMIETGRYSTLHFLNEGVDDGGASLHFLIVGLDDGGSTLHIRDEGTSDGFHSLLSQ